jgi:hypothetical protein
MENFKLVTSLARWYCDECNEIIENSNDGYLEWLTEDWVAHSFRIVHRAVKSPYKNKGRDCFKYTTDSKRGDNALDLYTGTKGMVFLLNMLDKGPILEPTFRKTFANVRDWSELFMRLNIPLYEEARRYWSLADADGFFEGRGVDCYLPETLSEIIEKYHTPKE